MNTISRVLLEAIEASGLSDRKLGMVAGVDRLGIGRFRRGGHLRSDTIDALCLALGLELKSASTRNRNVVKE